MARRRRSFAWSLRFKASDPEIRALSGQGRRGWECARELAENARVRSEEALRGEQVTEPLTLRRLADGCYSSPSTVRGWLRQARIELFGSELSDRAIRHRLRARGRTRPCAEPGCATLLSWQQPAHRRYCDQHHTPAARTRRHRRAP